MSATTTIDPTHSVSDILRQHPTMHPLLAEAGLDSCCGGADPLVDAARLAGVDLGLLLTAMHAELATEAAVSAAPACACGCRAS